MLAIQDTKAKDWWRKSMKTLVALALLAILGMCSIGSAQARLPVPHIHLQPPQAVQPQIVPALLADKCDLCVSVLTAIAKLASLNNTQVHHLANEFLHPICSSNITAGRHHHLRGDDLRVPAPGNANRGIV